MKYLLLAIAMGLPALAVADAAPGSAQQTLRTQLESMYRCQGLTAASDEQQEKKQQEADTDDEPDCD